MMNFKHIFGLVVASHLMWVAVDAHAQFGQVQGAGTQQPAYNGGTTATPAQNYKNVTPVPRATRKGKTPFNASAFLGPVDQLLSLASSSDKTSVDPAKVWPDFDKWAPEGTPDLEQTDVTREDWIRGRSANQQGAPDVNDPNFNWDRYSYPKNFRTFSGSTVGGDIGNGLCTETNRTRVQVANGYCQSLYAVLSGNEGSCANKALTEILKGMDEGKDYGMSPYCSNFSQLPREARASVFQQILAGLITQESGWNIKATEPGWMKGNQLMQGKGLFQIGTWDGYQDKDCETIKSSIYDPSSNMKCGACIALKNVAKDGVIASGSNDSNSRGLAAYFGPMRDGQAHKRAAVQRAVNSYCLSSAVKTGNPAGDASASAAPPTAR